MYPVDWWLKQGRVEGQQKAYDIIASSMPIRKQDVFLEVCCGPGEILKRVFGRVRKLVGADYSEEMLEVAEKNLRSAGISVEVFDNPVTRKIWVEELRRDRAVLVKDDIVDTALPEDYFTNVAVVFPCIGSPRVADPRADGTTL